mgnify:CR=1 FL=1
MWTPPIAWMLTRGAPELEQPLAAFTTSFLLADLLHIGHIGHLGHAAPSRLLGHGWLWKELRPVLVRMADWLVSQRGVVFARPRKKNGTRAWPPSDVGMTKNLVACVLRAHEDRGRERLLFFPALTPSAHALLLPPEDDLVARALLSALRLQSALRLSSY